MKDENKVIILIAEDDDGHAELIMDHLMETGLDNEIIHFKDGLALVNFLKGPKGKSSEKYRSRSFIVLLDINMPNMDGIEALRTIKADNSLKSLPVIMLTNTEDPEEIDECYELGCSMFITKPVNYELFANALKNLGLFIKNMQVPRLT